MSVQATYMVKGMTCDHCANAVSGEISAIGGVTDVDVNIADGKVTVTSEHALSISDVSAAVEEAGYELEP